MAPSSGLRPAAAETASRYEVLARIAHGGMASVFVGRVRGAVGFSRLVAIKRPHPFVSDDPALRNGFVLEARVAAAIHHPHVVSVLDVEVHGEEVSLILDYVEGCALSDLLSHAKRTGTPLPTRVAVRVILDAASGLHAAHVLCDAGGRSLGIVHRDVSPQNILVGLDGHARLTDFGIAKITVEGDHTATDVLKGKLGYMPREYVEKKVFDARSDEYALAVVAWEALTGGRLFHGGSDAETLRHILTARAAPPSSARPELAPFDDIFARALAGDPRERFDSVHAFAHALEDRARQRGWVAPHDEVARAVEAAVGDRLRERRFTIESCAPSLPAPPGAVPLPSPRDAMSTLSLPGALPEFSPASQPAAVSLTAPPRPPPQTARRRFLLAAAGAALLLSASLALLAVRCGPSEHRQDVGIPGAPNAALSSQLPSNPSAPPPSDWGTSAPSAPSEAHPASVETVASTLVEALPVASAPARGPARRSPPRKQPTPVRTPVPPARSNEVLFPNPG
jgi:serine/threonine-protein kinase